MAGSQNIGEASDNPVSLNLTAMVDVIFCLCIFFMCSFHFKQLEGKMETWLPKDRGQGPGAPDKVVLEEIRVIFRWDGNTNVTIRKVGNRAPAQAYSDLMAVILQMVNDYKKAGKTDFPVLLDSDNDVPWADVIHVMDLCKQENIERIEFTAPFETPQGPQPPAGGGGAH